MIVNPPTNPTNQITPVLGLDITSIQLREFDEPPKAQLHVHAPIPLPSPRKHNGIHKAPRNALPAIRAAPPRLAHLCCLALDPGRRGLLNRPSPLRYPHRPSAVEIQTRSPGAMGREQDLCHGSGGSVLPAHRDGAGHVRGAGAVFQTAVS